MRQLIRTYKITGDHLIAISNYSFTKEDVRLIINESLASTDKLSSVLVSSTAKDNIISVNDGVITLSDKTASLKSTDILTIEIDVDNVAKESTVISLTQALSQQMLDNTGDLAKELTNQEILSEIGDIDDALDGLNGENLPFDFVSDYAKQGDNPNATMTELLDAINAISPDLVQGKERLATAITSKGVETTSADSLSQMAENVSGISQESYTIDGGEMYAKQLYGSLETPNYWNMYEVLQNLLSDGRLSNYGGILLAEYSRDYDSITLEGAGSGGAYVVSDKVENGQFKMYTEDTTHIWTEEFDGKGNRWAAYCFANEWHDFQITDTNTSPRSIFIGRKVGTISCLVNTRISQNVVIDGNELKDFAGGSFAHEWNKQLVLRIKECGTTKCLNNVSRLESIYLQVDTIKDGCKVFSGTAQYNMPAIIVKTGEEIICSSARSALFDVNVNWGTYKAPSVFIVKGLKKCAGLSIFAGNNYSQSSVLGYFIAEDLEELYGSHSSGNSSALKLNAQRAAYFPVLEKVDRYYNGVDYGVPFSIIPYLRYIYFGYRTNDKTKTISLTGSSKGSNLTDVELKDGYCKSIEIGMLTDVLTEENMYNHILLKLKQDESNCGEGITITLGSTNLARLTSAESVALLDELTNTYGYTFA